MGGKDKMWRKGLVGVHPNLGKTNFHKWFITLFCVQVIVNIFTFLKLFMTQVSSPFGNKINIFIFEILILSHIYFKSNQCHPIFTSKNTLWLDNMELCSQHGINLDSSRHETNMVRLKTHQEEKITWKHGELSHTNLGAPLLTMGVYPTSILKLNNLISSVNL